MSDSVPVLHQFLSSHFNEKARWALDWKGVPHRRISHLPGPHAPAITKLSGQTMTPVLGLDGEVVAGSAAILDALERRHPEPALYPSDPGLRERALQIQSEFDEEVGPAVRTALFSVLIQEPGYVCRIFAREAALPMRLLYRGVFPLARSRIAEANGVNDPGGIERAFERSEQALDFVARQAGAEGPLVGGTFGVADLAAAALLAPLVGPAHPDIELPDPKPTRFRDFLARWAEHPGAAWVREQYARHRPASRALDAAA